VQIEKVAKAWPWIASGVWDFTILQYFTIFNKNAQYCKYSNLAKLHMLGLGLPKNCE